MAREATLEINCGRYSKRIVDLVELFNRIGWEYFNHNNEVEYLPLGDNGDYDWQKDSLLKIELQDLINKKQDNLEVVGLNLYYKNTGEGITFLARNTEEIVIDLDINRRTLEFNRESITDVGWYIENIIQSLIEQKCPIDFFRFEEYVD